MGDFSNLMLEQLIPGVLWTYLVLYFSTIIIGNAAAFSAFLLAFLGSFGPYGLFYVALTIIIADISADTLWYSLGRGLKNTRVGNFIECHLPHRARISRYVNDGNLKLIYPSKFISSTSAPFLFLIGWSNKIGYKKFFDLSLKSIGLWLVVMLLTSSLIGSGLLPFKSVEFFRKLEVLIPITLITYVILTLVIKKLWRAGFIKKLINGSN